MTKLLPAAAAGKAIEVWFQDDARVGQKGTLAYVWARCGTGARAVQGTLYGWASLFGAVCLKRVGLVIPDTITLVELPLCAPELNPIETAWPDWRGTMLAHRLFDSDKDIVDACCDAWSSFIADPATVRSIATSQ